AHQTSTSLDGSFPRRPLLPGKRPAGARTQRDGKDRQPAIHVVPSSGRPAVDTGEELLNLCFDGMSAIDLYLVLVYLLTRAPRCSQKRLSGQLDSPLFLPLGVEELQSPLCSSGPADHAEALFDAPQVLSPLGAPRSAFLRFESVAIIGLA